MNRNNIVIGTYPYHKCSLNYTLNSLKNIDAKNIEFVCCEPHFYFDDLDEKDPENLKNELAKKGLNMVVLTPPTLEYPTNLASDNINLRTKTINYIAKAIEYAHYFGAKVVTFSAGQVDSDKKDEDFLNRSVEAIKYLCEVAQALEVKLAVYVTNSRSTNLIYNLDMAKKLAKEVNSDALGFVADTVYLNKLELSVKDFVKELKNVPVVHMSDAKGNTTHLALGEGSLDIEKVLKDLDEIKYDGYLSLNMRGLRDPYSYEEQPERCTLSAKKWIENHIK